MADAPSSQHDVDALVRAAGDFVRETLVPLEHAFLQDGFGAVLPAVRAARDRVKALGLWAPHLPAALGGLGLSLPAFARVSEALGWSFTSPNGGEQ